MIRSLILILIFITMAGLMKAGAQGCVAVRSNGQVCTADMMQHGDMSDSGAFKSNSWQLNINNRYLKSYRHYRGSHEEKDRVENGSEVINHSFTTDLVISKGFGPRWAVSMDLPILANTRSSLYEHDGKTRHSTSSFGIGDIRFAVYNWLLDPLKMPKGNLQVGLGIKLPTGDYAFEDFFFTNDSTKRLGPVDQSIQPGDGGTGFSLELNGFYNFSRQWSGYGNFFYLLNPREQNGTSTSRGANPSITSIRWGSSVMSVPDQYMFRAGLNYAYQKLNIATGIRYDCVPVYDLAGGSSGFRRPGFIWSVEPTISYRVGKVNLYAAVPVALERNRTQSVPDKTRSEMTGTYFNGDAAFADYVVNVGCFFKF